MIFFLLLLSLNILETTEQQTDLSSAQKELELVRQQNELQRQHIKEMSEEISSYQSRIKSMIAKDESALIIERFRLDKQLTKLKKQLEKAQKKLAEEKDLMRQTQSKKRELAEKAAQVDKKLDENARLTKQNRQKQQQLEKIREDIKKKKNAVHVTVDGSINKIPLLIECSASKICIYDSSSNTKKILLRRTPLISELVSETVKNLQPFAIGKYYFVFLIKPSAANYSDYLLSRFRASKKSADSGVEPIAEHEGITNE